MQQHGGKYFTCSHPPPNPPTLVAGVKRSKLNFFRTWPCRISKLNVCIQQHGSMVANNLPADPPPTSNAPGVREGQKIKIQLFQNILPADPPLPKKAQNSTFAEYGHVSYQIKGNDAYNNMLANCCQYTHPLHLEQCQKAIFLKGVELHIKLMEIKHRTPCRQIFCPFTHPQPLNWVRRSKYIFSEGHVAYQVKRK